MDGSFDGDAPNGLQLSDTALDDDLPQLSRISEHDGTASPEEETTPRSSPLSARSHTSPSQPAQPNLNTMPMQLPSDVELVDLHREVCEAGAMSSEQVQRLEHLNQHLLEERERHGKETEVMREQLESRQQQIATLQRQLTALRAAMSPGLGDDRASWAHSPIHNGLTSPRDQVWSSNSSFQAHIAAMGQEEALQTLYNNFRLRDQTCQQLSEKVMELSDELQASHAHIQQQAEELQRLQSQLVATETMLQHMSTHVGLRDGVLEALQLGPLDELEMREEHYVRTVRTDRISPDHNDIMGVYGATDATGVLAAELTELRRRLEASEQSERQWQEREQHYKRLVAHLEARLEAQELPPDTVVMDGTINNTVTGTKFPPRLSVSPFETTLQERDVELLTLREREKGQAAEMHRLAQQLESIKSGDERSRTTALTLMTEVARLQGALDAEQDKADALGQQVNCLRELLQKAKETAAEQTNAAKKAEAMARDELRRQVEEWKDRIHVLEQQLAVKEEAVVQQAARLEAAIAEQRRLEGEARQWRQQLAEVSAQEQQQAAEVTRLRLQLADAAARVDAERARGESALRQSEWASGALADLQGRAESLENALHRRAQALLCGQEELGRVALQYDAMQDQRNLMLRLARSIQTVAVGAQRAAHQAKTEGQAAKEALSEERARAARLEQQLNAQQWRLLQGGDVDTQAGALGDLQQRLTSMMENSRQLTVQLRRAEEERETFAIQRVQALDETKALRGTLEQQGREKEQMTRELARLKGLLEASGEEAARMSALEQALRSKEVELSQARRREQQALAEAAHWQEKAQNQAVLEEELRQTHSMEVTRLQGMVESAERQAAVLQQEVELLGNELQSAERRAASNAAATLEEVRAKMVTLQEERDKLITANSAVANELQDAKATVDHNAATMQTLQDECAAAHQETETLRRQIMVQDSALRAAEGEKARLAGVLNATQEVVTALRSQQEKAAEERREMEEGMAELLRKLGAHQVAMEEQQRRAEEWQQIAEERAAETEKLQQSEAQATALHLSLQTITTRAKHLEEECEHLRRQGIEQDGRLREAAARISAQEALLAERHEQLKVTELELVQVRTVHHETEVCASRLDLDLADAKAEVAALQGQLEAVRNQLANMEEQATELARLRTLVDCHEAEINRLQSLEQASRRATMLLSQLQGEQRQQLTVLEAVQRQLIMEEEQVAWLTGERRDMSQRLATAQGLLDSQEATHTALRGQVARLTELLQAERRAFADRLAEGVAQIEAKLAEALAGEQRNKAAVAELTVRLQALDEALSQKDKEVNAMSEELESARTLAARNAEELAQLQAQLVAMEEQHRRELQTLATEAKQQQMAAEAAQAALQELSARLVANEQQLQQRAEELDETKRQAEEQSRRLAWATARLEAQVAMEEELAHAENQLRRVEEAHAQAQRQLREMTQQQEETASQLVQRLQQVADLIEQLEQAHRAALQGQALGGAGMLRIQMLDDQLRRAEAMGQMFEQQCGQLRRQAEEAMRQLVETQDQLRRTTAALREQEENGYEVARLQGLLQGKEDQIRRLLPLEAEVTTRTAEVVQLQDQVSILERQAQVSAADIADLRRRLVASEAVCQQQATHITALETEVLSMEGQLEMTRRSLEKAEFAHAEEMAERVAQLERKEVNWQSRLEDAKQLVEQHKRDAEELASKLQAAIRMAEERDLEVTRMTRDMQSERENWGQEMATLTQERQRLQQMETALQAQLAITTKSLEEAERSVVVLREQDAQKAATIEAQRENNVALEQRTQEMERALQSCEQSVRELQDRVHAAERAAVAAADEVVAAEQSNTATLQQKNSQIARLEEANRSLTEELAVNRSEAAALGVRAEDLQRQMAGMREELRIKETTYLTEIRTLTTREEHANSLVPHLQDQLKIVREQLAAAEKRALEAARLAGVLQAKEQLLGRLQGVEDRLHETELELAKEKQRYREQGSRLQRAELQAETLQSSREETEEANHRLTTQVARLQASLDAQKGLVTMLRQQLESLTRLIEDDLAALPAATPGAPVPPPAARARDTITDLHSSLTEQLSQQIKQTEAAYQEQGRQLEQQRSEVRELRLTLATASHDLALSQAEIVELRQITAAQQEEIRRLEGHLTEANQARMELHAHLDFLARHPHQSNTGESPTTPNTAQATAHLAGILEAQQQDFRRQWGHQTQLDWAKVHAREAEMDRQLEQARSELEGRRGRQVEVERQLQEVLQRCAAWEAAVDAERERADALQHQLDHLLPRLGGMAVGPPLSPPISPRNGSCVQQQVTVQTVRRVYQYGGGPRLSVTGSISPRTLTPEWDATPPMGQREKGQWTVVPSLEKELEEQQQEVQRLEAEMEIVRDFDTKRQEQVCLLAQEVSRLRPFAPGEPKPPPSPEVTALTAELHHITSINAKERRTATELRSQLAIISAQKILILEEETLRQTLTIHLFQELLRAIATFPSKSLPGVPGPTVASIPSLGLGLWTSPQTRALTIVEVQPESIADQAGLQPLDVVLGYNGQAIHDEAQLKALLRRSVTGGLGSITLAVLRGDQPLEIHLPGIPSGDVS